MPLSGSPAAGIFGVFVLFGFFRVFGALVSLSSETDVLIQFMDFNYLLNVPNLH